MKSVTFDGLTKNIRKHAFSKYFIRLLCFYVEFLVAFCVHNFNVALLVGLSFASHESSLNLTLSFQLNTREKEEQKLRVGVKVLLLLL